MLTHEEKTVAEYIAKHPDGDFTGVLRDDQSFETFHHLTPMRESILNWYDFAPDSSVLEMNGEMGALTGLLCERCARVVTVQPDADKAEVIRARYARYNNLTVTDGAEGFGGESFDYIVALDPPETTAEALSDMHRRLSPRGRLLLAAENRFGLRHWCGTRSRRTGVPFDGIAGRDGSAGKVQIADALKQAGFEGQKWYYPMSDHWFAQDIFSENYMPSAYLPARFKPYVVPGSTVIVNEQRLYSDIIRSGVFDFFSNAYLVEARKCESDAPCRVDFAAVTTYRDTDKRFATLICGDIVYKRPLHPDGQKGVQNLIRNHEALAARGFDVAPLKLEGGGIVMPRVRHETLIDYWQRTLQDGSFDYEAFSNLFDRMYDNIIRASDADAPGTHGWDPALGPVQKRAYMELVPANCFYDAEADRLIYFDQEFARENCPVSLAVIRLVTSIVYSGMNQDEKINALYDEFTVRYGIAGCLDYLREEEDRFLGRVFNFETIFQIEQLRWVDEGRIEYNRHVMGKLGVAYEMRRLLDDTQTKQIAIYGYGKRGKGFYRVMTFAGIRIAFALDKSAKAALDGKASYPPLEVYRDFAEAAEAGEVGLIVVTVKEGAEDIVKELRERTDCKIVSLNWKYGEFSVVE